MMELAFCLNDSGVNTACGPRSKITSRWGEPSNCLRRNASLSTRTTGSFDTAPMVWRVVAYSLSCWEVLTIDGTLSAIRGDRVSLAGLQGLL